MKPPLASFPTLGAPLPLSPKTIALARGTRFQKDACPLCGAGDAGTLAMPGQDAAWWICGTCQRFSITGPASAYLRRLVAERHVRYARIRTGLSRRCAASKRPVAIDETNLMDLSEAGLAIAVEDR